MEGDRHARRSGPISKGVECPGLPQTVMYLAVRPALLAVLALLAQASASYDGASYVVVNFHDEVSDATCS